LGECVIAGYAMQHGLMVDRVFVERGVSGSKPLGERPEGAALLAALRRGDVVITATLGSDVQERVGRALGAGRSKEPRRQPAHD
jgi:DNA invertase Pin-like site-specific DNA recombinase